MSEVKRVLNFLENKADYADLRVERNHINTIKAKDGKLKDINSFLTYGVGVRVLYNGCWGFASVNDKDKIKKAGKKALRIAKAISKVKRRKIKLAEVPFIKDKFFFKPKKDFRGIDLTVKKKLVLEINKESLDFKEISGATTSYLDSLKKVTFLSSEGSRITSIYPRIIIGTVSVAKGKAKGRGVQQGSKKYGYLGGFEHVEDKRGIGKKASQKAIRKLKAKPTPPGKFTLVLDPELVGVLIHEAFGHAAEADTVLKGGSILENKLGGKVASSKVTIVDDPSFRGSGFYKYDAEGVRAKKTILVENGELKSFLHSRETASEFQTEPTGNARAQGYADPPLVRMSNTYLEVGDSSVEELFEGKGIYCKGAFGGQVNPTTGYFSFTAREAFLFEKGEKTEPLRDVTLSGNILELLKNIEMVGEDFKITNCGGGCGKEGQSVRVDFGGPHVKIKKVLVGGRV